jgi:hypothetical protein
MPGLARFEITPLAWRLAFLLLAAGMAATLRWGLMAFDPPLWATMVLQCLEASALGILPRCISSARRSRRIAARPLKVSTPRWSRVFSGW